MSLDPKKGVKTKHIDISGTQKDFDALADVFRQAAAKTNIDLVPGDLDIPGRILIRKSGTLGKKEKATQWEYPKLNKAMTEFADGLVEPGDAVVDFGKTRITDKPEHLIKDSPTLRKMNQNATGKNLGFGDIYKEDITSDLNRMLDPKDALGRDGPMVKMVPVWVHVSDLVSHDGRTPIGLFAKDKKMLENIDDYPPDLAGDKSWSGYKKDGYNQAYFVILRVDKLYPMDAKLGTLPGLWDKWIRSRPVPAMMSLYKNSPPKNFGQLLERFAVYSTARTFGMRDAFLAPVFAGTNLTQRVGSSKDYADKIVISEAIKSQTGKLSHSEYATYMGFVVVGKGASRTVDLGKEPMVGATELPGWD
jgi:hypothetical protein